MKKKISSVCSLLMVATMFAPGPGEFVETGMPSDMPSYATVNREQSYRPPVPARSGKPTNTYETPVTSSSTTASFVPDDGTYSTVTYPGQVQGGNDIVTSTPPTVPSRTLRRGTTIVDNSDRYGTVSYPDRQNQVQGGNNGVVRQTTPPVPPRSTKPNTYETPISSPATSSVGSQDEDPYVNPYASADDNLPGQVSDNGMYAGIQGGADSKDDDTMYITPRQITPPVSPSRRPTVSNMLPTDTPPPVPTSRRPTGASSMIPQVPQNQMYEQPQLQQQEYDQVTGVEKTINGWMQESSNQFNSADIRTMQQHMGQLEQEVSTDTDPRVQQEEQKALSLWQRFKKKVGLGGSTSAVAPKPVVVVQGSARVVAQQPEEIAVPEQSINSIRSSQALRRIQPADPTTSEGKRNTNVGLFKGYLQQFQAKYKDLLPEFTVDYRKVITNPPSMTKSEFFQKYKNLILQAQKFQQRYETLKNSFSLTTAEGQKAWADANIDESFAPTLRSINRIVTYAGTVSSKKE